MTSNRSPEELEMRGLAEIWGRKRWPGARVVHELVVGERRIDMAFIGTDHLAGLEIKSERDVLDRLDPQLVTFRAALPEVWVFAAARWDTHHISTPFGRLWIGADGTASTHDPKHGWPQPAKPDRSVTVSMLGLLWQAELFSLAVRSGLSVGRRTPIRPLVETIARALTGDQIVAGVCAQLRARDAFPKIPRSDPPIRCDVTPIVSASAQDLFRVVTP